MKAFGRGDGGPTPWRHLAGDSSARAEGGFSLVELLIVIAILPLVVGGITVALISVFSIQSSVSNRLTYSGEAQVVSASFVADVHSATMVTTESPSSPQCVPGTTQGTQLLGLQSNGGETVISYEEVANGSTNDLVRYVCQNGNFTTPVTSSTLSYDVQSDQAATVTTAATSSCTNAVAASGWISAACVTGVTLKTTEAASSAASSSASSYQFSLAAVPKVSVNPGQLSTGTTTPNSSCGFAAPGSGTYASSLCFIDFRTDWNNQLSAPGMQCAGGAAGISAAIADTPYTMSFCMSVVSQSSDGAPLVGTTTAVDGGIAVSGFDDITAVPLPTYYDPPVSEAFLGNGGFYTGVPGNPALYTVDEGSIATVTISNIQVLDAQGNPATDWQLVTGDAESTDPGESLTWSTGATGPVLNLIPNVPASGLQPSDVGNACGSTLGPSYNTKYLTGIGTTTVACVAPSNQQGEKSGTVMLEALSPSSLTVTLVGSGRQAMFLGLLLS